MGIAPISHFPQISMDFWKCLVFLRVSFLLKIFFQVFERILGKYTHSITHFSVVAFINEICVLLSARLALMRLRNHFGIYYGKDRQKKGHMSMAYRTLVFFLMFRGVDPECKSSFSYSDSVGHGRHPWLLY